MATVYCFYEKDYDILTEKKMGFLDTRLYRMISVLKFVKQNEQKIWLLGDGARALILHTAAEFGYDIIEEEVAFPPRVRWGNRSEDRLVALRVRHPEHFSISKKVRSVMDSWQELHNMKIEVVDAKGTYVPPGNNDVFRLVVFGSPVAVDGYEAGQPSLRWLEGNVQAILHNPLPGLGQSFNSVFLNIERVGNTVYILWPIQTGRFADLLIQKIIHYVTPDLTALSSAALIERNKQSLDLAKQMMLNRFVNEYKFSCVESTQTHHKKIEEEKVTLAQYAERVREIWQKCTSGLQDDVVMQAARNDFRRIKQIDKIEHVKAIKEGICVFTKPLLIKHPNTGDLYLGGRYKITFNNNGVILIQNLSRQVGQFHHPHVRDNYICFGNIEQILPNLIKQGQIAAAILMIIAYLETCNVDDRWGAGITLWPLAAHLPTA